MDIEEAQKVNAIAHGLGEAKVAVRRDFGFDVAGVKVEGRDGDVASMPRWMGRIVQEAGLGTMESADMVKELKQALSKEKMMAKFEVSTLEPHFYIKLKETMEGLDRFDLERVEDLLLQLFRLRRGKLVALADTTDLTPELNARLTSEERAFYLSIRENSLGFERQIRGGGDE